MSATEDDKMVNFLTEIQLEQFYYLFVRNLHVTRITHFDHVEEIDLTGIGMSKPEQRRLFEHFKKYKKPSLKKLFKKSFKLDGTKRVTSPPLNQQNQSHNSSVDRDCEDSTNQHSMTVARNNIRQGLKCLISERDIELGEFLGKGAFGYVRKGIWTTDKGSQTNVAVKSLKPSHDEASVMLQAEFINEANAMSNLDHPNLIRLHGIVLTCPMMLVTELAELGSLLVRLRKEPEKFLISILCSFVVQIVSGMKYLESNRFIHRDMAARNILLVSYEKIKIGDFGLMRALPSDADYYVMQPTGLVPFAWCATECLKYRRFSHASDVWAFGVTVLELFSYGSEPWPGLNGSQILEKIDAPNFHRPDRPDHCPVEIYKIIRNFCWCHEPEERKSFEVLEKLILEALPKEQNASCSYTTEKRGEISFEVGDPLTIIEASHDAEYVKAQNRKTGKVGYIPIRLIVKYPPIVKPKDNPFQLSPANAKSESISTIKRSNVQEIDSLSLASRESASSSGSDSSGVGSAKYPFTRGNTLHSNPRDIPSRRQSSLSSGYGSAGPSYSNSMKEELFVRGSIESGSSSQDGASRKTSTTFGTIEEDVNLTPYDNTESISSYENVTIDDIRTSSSRKSSQACYENADIPTFSPGQIGIRHSSPISIHEPSLQRHFSTTSGSIQGQEETGSPASLNIVSAQRIVSMPANGNRTEAEAQLNSSTENEVETHLSNSAPTTQSEMKAFRKSNGKKHSAQMSTVTSHRSSFGSYMKEKWLPQVYQTTDNVVYECMTPDKPEQQEVYELMTNNYSRESGQTDDSGCYENTMLSGKSSERKPPLPERTFRTKKAYEEAPDDDLLGATAADNQWIIPAKTYRNNDKDIHLVTRSVSCVTSYENCQPSRFPSFDPMLPTKTSSVRPRKYNLVGEEPSCPVNRTFELPPKTYKRCEMSYENVELQPKDRVLSTSYENYSLPVDDSPPPLPRKKSQQKQSSESKRVQPQRGGTNLSLFEAASSPVFDTKEVMDGQSLPSWQKFNLIDDSPMQESLPRMCDAVRNEKDVFVNDGVSGSEFTLFDAEDQLSKDLIEQSSEKKGVIDSKKEAVDLCAVNKDVLVDEVNRQKLSTELLEDCQTEKRTSDLQTLHEEVCGHKISNKESVRKDGQDDRENEGALISTSDDISDGFGRESSELLRALLSPTTQHLSRKLGRCMSEDSPVARRSSSEESPTPPPRKSRKKRKEMRRHTLAESTVNTRCSTNIPYDCAIEKTRIIADAPLHGNSDASPLPLRISTDDIEADAKCNERQSVEQAVVVAVEAEPKKIKIRSLLSQEVANLEETDIISNATASLANGKDKPKDDDEEDHSDVRYVVHFVTPV
eukprot:gene15433-17007_t